MAAEGKVEALKVEAINNIKWVSHGFYTRKGGYSKGIYSSLNCSMSKEDKEIVMKNRQLIATDLGFPNKTILLPVHTHGSGVVICDEKTVETKITQDSDALVTKFPGLVLGVLGADCPPVLFASNKQQIIGAAHCGWKGTKKGVVRETVQAMVKLGADVNDIVCGVGPFLGPKSYEVDPPFVNEFLQENEQNSKFFKQTEGGNKYMFDLGGYLHMKLNEAGIKNENINFTGVDSFVSEEVWYSYRRSVKKKENGFGNNCSVIAIKL